MMHAFEQAPEEARERCVDLIRELYWMPVRGGVDYTGAFMDYILNSGPRGANRAVGEVVDRRAPELRGIFMTSGDELRREGRQEGRLEGRQEGRLETIEGFLRAGVDWPVIESATGIDEQTYRGHKAVLINGRNGAAR